MARNITVSALGPGALQVDAALSNGQIVKKMAQHWTDQIQSTFLDQPDLIVLHEACDRPAAFPAARRLEYYQERGEQIRELMGKLAIEGNCNIAYSAVRQMPDGSYRNMTELINRQGQGAGHYSKNHLVPSEYDNFNVLYGKEPSLIQLDIGTVAPAICFDLNYTELLDGIVPLKPDMILFSSMYHGGLMQPYWAYTARAHFIGAVCALPCNIYNPAGHMIASNTNYFSSVTTSINLDCAVIHLDNHFKKIEACKRKYGTGFKMEDPGYLGAVLVSCCRDDMTISDMLKEFEIITVDQYFAQCRAHRQVPGHMEG